MPSPMNKMMRRGGWGGVSWVGVRGVGSTVGGKPADVEVGSVWEGAAVGVGSGMRPQAAANIRVASSPDCASRMILSRGDNMIRLGNCT